MRAPTPRERADPGPGEAPKVLSSGRAVCVVSLWATGPDPATDSLLNVDALRLGPGADAEGEPRSQTRRFRRRVNPDPDSKPPTLSARTVREFGVTGADLAGAGDGASAWRELREFADGAVWLVADADSFRAWRLHFESEDARTACVLGLDEFRARWLPGRPLAGRDGAARSRGSAFRAIDALELRAMWAGEIERARDLGEGALALAAAAAGCALALAREHDPAMARQLELELALLAAPRAHLGEVDLFAGRADDNGTFADAAACADAIQAAEDARDLLDGIEPRWADVEPRSRATVAVTNDDAKPFSEADLRLLDDVFQVHLPAVFEQDGETARTRPGQLDVAREVARSLGSEELLLVHAPTGTGKTLAYLVPALIWSARHGVRVGVTTYTRALQEQAMDREVPRALRALHRAVALGENRLPVEPRVTLLKGRANYLCWRALKLHLPSAADGLGAWTAWLTLFLFSQHDDAGDLDRLSQAQLELPARDWDGLLRQVRAQVGCCQHRDDRRTCAAEVARQAAERSHVVIANHAFALSRQAFFKHVVFDECEHLHEQAHAAWSHTLTVEDLRQLLGRLHQAGRDGSRAPLDRMERLVVASTRAHTAHANAMAAWKACHTALGELDVQLARFLEWRADAERTRDGREVHSLLREYVLDASHHELRTARAALSDALTGLAVQLAGVAETLDGLSIRGIPRLRRQFELLLIDVDDANTALNAWLPVRDGEVDFQEHTFYDVERELRGRTQMVARVLLPNEYLGRHYFPEIKNAVLLSATTWLRGGFESAMGYLGLDRAANPAQDEVRPPVTVRCVRAPDPFDYSRVLVGLPSDAPSYSGERNEWNAYVRRFIAHLGERTRGRMLVLFTNQEELRRCGEELAGFFAARRIPFWYQGMRGVAKEQLVQRFRRSDDAVLMGVDTFWYGADFPGEALEYLLIAKLPYGVPDRYHQAQCAALGSDVQRRKIYLPRALAKFRQGFGRLMRRETDRGCVFVLDPRIREARHRLFLNELPLAGARGDGDEAWSREGARLSRGTTDEVLHAALAHMDMLSDVRRRGLDISFQTSTQDPNAGA